MTMAKYIVRGSRRIDGMIYDIKDGIPTLDAARDYRDKLARGETTMPDGHTPDTRDTFSIARYERRSYDAIFVE